MLIGKIILIKSSLTGAFYDRSKLICLYLNEGYKVPKYNICFKLMIQARLHVSLFRNIFIKHVLFEGCLSYPAPDSHIS